MPVRVIPPTQSDAVLDVLCDAFYDYSVMRYVLGPARNYPERLRTLIGLFVAGRASPQGRLLGVLDDDGTLAAAAVVDLPGDRLVLPALERLRAAVWRELGADARLRYEAYGTASRSFEPSAPHHHLGLIGVRASHQGSGLGRVLLDHVHSLAAADPASTGVSLTTELERNVGLYRYFGYDLAGQARVAAELETWCFFRPVARMTAPGPAAARREG